MTLPYPEVTFTDAQHRKIAEITPKMTARARRPYAQVISLYKRAIRQISAEIYLTKVLTRVLKGESLATIKQV